MWALLQPSIVSRHCPRSLREDHLKQITENRFIVLGSSASSSGLFQIDPAGVISAAGWGSGYFPQKQKDCFPMTYKWCNNSAFRFEGGLRQCLKVEQSRVEQYMWIEKLIDGIVQLDTPIGPRYVQPNLLERAYLIWTFRNFFSLPQQVLRPWQRRLIDRLWTENRFVSLGTAAASDRPIIGRVERRAPVPAEVVPIRKPVLSSNPSSNTAVAEPNQEAASA